MANALALISSARKALAEAVQPRKPATYFPQAGHRAYEPTESEICLAAREIQDHWTDKERRSRGYTPGPGVDGPGIRVINVEIEC